MGWVTGRGKIARLLLGPVLSFVRPSSQDARNAANPRSDPLHTHYRQMDVKEGSVGYGLETVFRVYVDSELTAVEIDDPYIKSDHQIDNFFALCALLIKRELI
ncbi:hypothetical protein BV898_16352 [Hypsibius exemplaris]|uniref:MITD1 C-terminal phospholipase D-like domain-containing protein n=1 Tax=Hypsibius exemplaris TaxID=2072580 RepID=A0A9X6RLQ8_HYPEX|nr:hypothetical protein BV898_16352 [Hypsibius exemplaris]